MGSSYLKCTLGAFAAICLCFMPATASAEEFCAPSEATDPQALHINGATPFVYKTIGDAELRLHVFRSAAHGAGARSPAVVFFYGGGFLFGDIRRFQTQATHLALRGLVTVLVDYRVRCRHGSTIMDSITDGKSAMRWVRGHADELGIDSTRIAAVGSSAGGVIAAATALVTDFDDPNDAAIDPRPNALILYNPGLAMSSPTAIENMTARWGSAVAARAPDFSPIDHLDRGLPPTIIFQGAEDPYTPPATAEDFCRQARALDALCDVVLYPGATHGFTEVWLGLQDPAAFPNTEFWASDTSRRTDEFLTALGWLPAR
jgi:acetyl esterase